MSSPAGESKAAEAQNTRWWESYLVRYFIGFIVGGLCVAVLGFKLFHQFKPIAGLSTFLGPGSKLEPAYILLPLAMIGLGYCYVASTPITVLHLGRYDRGPIDGHSRHFWLGWLLTLVVSLVTGNHALELGLVSEVFGIALSICCIAILPTASDYYPIKNFVGNKQKVFNHIEESVKQHPIRLLLYQSILFAVAIWCIAGASIELFGPVADGQIVRLWLLGAPIFWIGLAQYFVLFRLITDKEKLLAFYADLFRARRRENAKDIRDTYTHLREHSNSVFIVVVELAMLAFLLAAAKSMGPTGPGSGTSFAAIVSIALAIWMMPTVFLWARANMIEREFSKNPEFFLSTPPNTKASNGVVADGVYEARSGQGHKT